MKICNSSMLSLSQYCVLSFIYADYLESKAKWFNTPLLV